MPNLPVTNDDTIEDKKPIEKVNKSTLKEGLFLASVAGISTMFGFGVTIAMAKKKDPNSFIKGLIAGQGIPESGAALATRALGWGTLYAVSGFGLFTFIVWKSMGVHSMEEFTAKIKTIMPNVPKESTGKNDFKNASELIEYIINDGREKPKPDSKS